MNPDSLGLIAAQCLCASFRYRELVKRSHPDRSAKPSHVTLKSHGERGSLNYIFAGSQVRRQSGNFRGFRKPMKVLAQLPLEQIMIVYHITVTDGLKQVQGREKGYALI